MLDKSYYWPEFQLGPYTMESYILQPHIIYNDVAFSGKTSKARNDTESMLYEFSLMQQPQIDTWMHYLQLIQNCHARGHQIALDVADGMLTLDKSLYLDYSISAFVYVLDCLNGKERLECDAHWNDELYYRKMNKIDLHPTNYNPWGI